MSVALAEPSALEALEEAARDRSRAFMVETQALVVAAGRLPRAVQVTVDDREIAIDDAAVDLIAVRLRRSPITVHQQVRDARRLVNDLPRTVAALAEGSISPEHARVIVRVADGLEGVALRAFESRVVARAANRTPGETASWARRVRASVDEAGEEERRERARKYIDVRIWAEDDGLACVQARMPLTDAARVHAILQERARQVELPCDASMGERRVAALVEGVCGSGSTAPVGVEVQVTVDLATLLHLADHPALVSTPGSGAEPITAEALRDVLADDAIPVSFRRLVIDPQTGHLLDRGRRAYRPPTSLRDFLVARDGTCRFPGCGRSARSCEMDHVRPWEQGGTTDRTNLGPLCARHHLLKTHAGWSITSTDADGTTRWRGPDGETYVFRPLDLRPTRTIRSLSSKKALKTKKRPPPTDSDPPF